MSHPEHGEAAVGDDGLFEVGEEFGRALLAGPDWMTPDQHAARTHALDVSDLYDARRGRAVLDKLRARIVAVKAGEEEPPAAAWQPDPTTVGVLSMVFRSEHWAVDEFWRLQEELLHARPGAAPAVAGDEPPAGPASRSAGPAGSSGKGEAARAPEGEG